MFTTMFFSATVMAAPLTSETLSKVRAWQALEQRVDLLAGHASTATLVTDAKGVTERTELAVVIVSGLYNSPVHMDGLARNFSAQGMNVLSVRLAGHYEVDRAGLRESVRWQDWKSQTDHALALAKELGQNVILVGHSTGALLLTWAAIDHPDRVRALALFAPAFRVHPVARATAGLLRQFKLDFSVGDARRITGHAALEVEKLGAAFDLDAWARAPRSLRDVAVWIGQTEIDMVVDRARATEFRRTLTFSDRPRVEYTVPLCEAILHDRLISPGTRVWSELLRSMHHALFL